MGDGTFYERAFPEITLVYTVTNDFDEIYAWLIFIGGSSEIYIGPATVNDPIGIYTEETSFAIAEVMACDFSSSSSNSSSSYGSSKS